MTDVFRIRRLRYEDIRQEADSFLSKYHPVRSIPVPIEDIVDVKMHINIVPLPGLHRLIEADGFISSDMTSIYIEDCVHENRYRYTLAHETGHIFLHSTLYQGATFNSIDAYRDFVAGISDADYRWLEWQARSFAGLVLVPSEHLRALSQGEVDRVEREGISVEQNRDFVRDCISESLGRVFMVSSQVIETRLHYEGIFRCEGPFPGQHEGRRE